MSAPCGQVFQRLLVGGHDVGRLHPRNVLLLARAELAETEIGLVDADAHQRFGEVGQVGDDIREAGEIAVQAADHADLALAGLRLGLDAGDERARILRLEIDLAAEAGQHVVANALLFLDRRTLVRPEQDRRGGSRRRRGGGDENCGACQFQ